MLIRYNTYTPWRITSTIQTTGTITIFSFWYHSCIKPRSDLFCWQNSYSVCKSRIDLVVVLEYTVFQVFPTPNNYPRFTTFRRSYVNHPAVTLIKVTLLFCLSCAVQSGDVLLLTAVCSQWQYICVTYFCWVHLLLECC